MDIYTLILVLAFIFCLTLVALVAIAHGKEEIAKHAVNLLGKVAVNTLKMIGQFRDDQTE
jgi:hypothetical protein